MYQALDLLLSSLKMVQNHLECELKLYILATPTHLVIQMMVTELRVFVFLVIYSDVGTDRANNTLSLWILL